MPVLKKVLRNVLREPLQKATPAPVYAPDLDLKFAEELRLDPRVDFSRGSNATVVDSDGTLKWAGHNLVAYSQEFDNPAWGSSDVTCTSGFIAPDGTATAYSVTTDGSSAFLQLGGPLSLSQNTEYTYGVFIKEKDGLSRQRFGIFDDVNSWAGYIEVTWTSGEPTTSSNSNASNVSYVDLSNGWYFLSFSVTTSSASLGNVTFQVHPDRTATGNLGVFIWGAHVYRADKEMQERTDVATGLETYYPTTASAYYAPRFDHDPATNESLGLLIEEARTNKITRSDSLGNWSLSDSTLSTNATTAPDGTTNAVKLVENTNNDDHYIVFNVSITSGATCTLSAFLKQSESNRHGYLRTSNEGTTTYIVVDLSNGTVSETGSDVTSSSVQDFGNGWYRASFTYTNAGDTGSGFIIGISNSTTPSDNSVPYTGDGSSGIFVFGAQFEEGAFPTSYIPTSGSTVTRSADVADVLTSTFGFSANEGTLFVEADTYDSTQSFNRFVGINNDSNFNDAVSLQMASGNLKGYIFSGGTTYANLTPGSISNNSFFKGVIGYQTDNVAGCLDGGSLVTDTSATMPVAANMTHLNIGTSTGTGSFQNGHIKQLTYFARRLDDATLQALTQPSLEPSLNLVFDSSETSYVNTGLTR